MMKRFLALFWFLMGCLHAETPCPWMNGATAGGFLGGDATAAFAPGAHGQESGQCRFARTTDPKIKLRIEVAIMKSVKTEFPAYLDQCRSNSKPLKAIGNEAMVCNSDGSQRVVSRVRDQAFVLTITAPNITEETARKTAEIVAGNLF